MKICILIIFLLSVSACSQIPLSVDTSTYMAYSEKVKDQRDSADHELIGLYRIAFMASKKIQSPSDAIAIKGDWKAAAIKRGGYIDFISLSGYKGFSGSSDQGGSYTVNLQGSTLFSVEPKKVNGGYKGKWLGIMKGKSGVSKLEQVNGWLIIQTTYSPSKYGQNKHHEGNSTEGTLFLKALE